MTKQELIDGLHKLVAAGEADLGQLKADLEHIGQEIVTHVSNTVHKLREGHKPKPVEAAAPAIPPAVKTAK